MGNLHNVVWFEGMSLDPHHFQQLNRYYRHAQEMRFRALNPNSWGVIELQVDRDSLSNGKLSLLKCTAIMPDGCIVDIPKTHSAPPMRSIQENFAVTDESITAFLALPGERFNDKNCEIDLQKNKISNVRFITEIIKVRDDNSGHDEREIEIALPNIAIMFSNENREGYILLPLAEIHRNPEGQYILKDEFIPPSVYCSSSTRLAILLTNILEMLVGKSSSLWHSRKLPSSGDRTFTPNDAFNLGILKVLHHYLPLLRHAQSALMHPESLYLLLCSLIGELYTYSALGENLFDQIPSYDHQKLTQTFNPLEKTIRLLIQGVGATRNYISIPLKKVENTLYHGEIKETYDFQLWNVYLMVVSNLPDTELIHQVTNIVKIASIDELHNLEEFALRGVEAVFASRVPFGLPASKENSYFQLNTSGFLWKKIIESKTIAMRIPQNLTEAKFELALIKKE